jgi:hypothetical protein
MAVSGTEFAVGGLGVLLIWSGISNKGFLTSVRDVVQGVEPTAGPKQNLFTPSSTATSAQTTAYGLTASGANPTAGTTDAQNQALGQSMAAAYGWNSGDQWTALNDIVEAESGWDDEAANPDSDARGIAQDINGWSQGYQQGNAAQQISWLLTYIKQRYGNPTTAWQFHLANGWY